MGHRAHCHATRRPHRIAGDGEGASTKVTGEAVCLEVRKMGKFQDKWTTAIWRGKEVRSDGRIVAVGVGVVLARSVRRKPEDKRWGEGAAFPEPPCEARSRVCRCRRAGA